MITQNHYGGMGGGHYTAMAYHSELGQWYHYDDDSVQPITEDVTSAVVSPAAYILFYKRREM